MQYMCLIYGSAATETSKTPEQIQTEMQEYFTYNAEARAAGVYVSGEALHPVSTATTVRVRSGKTLTTDGPFAETVEVLGGYYILNCATLDDAIAWAAKLPGARDGSVEIRPLVDFSQV